MRLQRKSCSTRRRLRTKTWRTNSLRSRSLKTDTSAKTRIEASDVMTCRASFETKKRVSAGTTELQSLPNPSYKVEYQQLSPIRRAESGSKRRSSPLKSLILRMRTTLTTNQKGSWSRSPKRKRASSNNRASATIGATSLQRKRDLFLTHRRGRQAGLNRA